MKVEINKTNAVKEYNNGDSQVKNALITVCGLAYVPHCRNLIINREPVLRHYAKPLLGAVLLTNSNKMEILIKHYGNSRTTPSKIIELTCKDYDTQFTVDVTNLKGLVDVNLIENLRQVADELEEQNRLVNELSEGVVS